MTSLITIEEERKKYAGHYRVPRVDREAEARKIAKRKGASFPKSGKLPGHGTKGRRTKGRRLYNNAMRQLQRYSTEKGAERRSPPQERLIEIIDALPLSSIVVVGFQVCAVYTCSSDVRNRCVILSPSSQGQASARRTVKFVLTSEDEEEQAGAVMSGSELRDSCEVEEIDSVMVVDNERERY